MSPLRESELKLALIAKSWLMMSPNAGVEVVKASKHAAMKEVKIHDVKCNFLIMLTSVGEHAIMFEKGPSRFCRLQIPTSQSHRSDEYIMGVVWPLFHPKTQLNDALIES